MTEARVAIVLLFALPFPGALAARSNGWALFEGRWWDVVVMSAGVGGLFLVWLVTSTFLVSQMRRRKPRGRHRAPKTVPPWYDLKARGNGGRRRPAESVLRSNGYDDRAFSARDRPALALPPSGTPGAQLSPAPWRLPEAAHASPPSIAMLGDVELWLAATENGDDRLLRDGLRAVASSWPTRVSPAADLTRRLSRETQTVENGWRSGRLPAQEAARRLAAVVGEIDAYWWDRSALPPEAARTVRQIVRAAIGTPNSPSAVNDLVRGARRVRDALGAHWAEHEVRWKKRESESADLLSQVVAWQRDQGEVRRVSKGPTRASVAALKSLIIQIDGFFATRWEEARDDGEQLALRLAASVGQTAHGDRSK